MECTNTVTSSVCVPEGIECRPLVSLDGKLGYSLARDRRLKVSIAHRITGTIRAISTCMQGPHLAPAGYGAGCGG